MKVVSYYNVVPTENKSEEKLGILTKFIQGVNAVGDTGILHTGFNIVDADVAIIQGWQHEKGKTAPHLALRSTVADTQISNGKYVCTGDSNLFLYANKSNSPHHYLRYSLNGIFPNTGVYCDKSPDPKRWQQISNDTGIRLEDSKRNGKNIVLFCQRNGGWSMGKYDVASWIQAVIHDIRKHSDRPIVLRPHPGDKKASTYINASMPVLKRYPNVRVSPIGTPLESDLKNAWAVVNHNSSSVVGPIIQGIPAFITDPSKSQCAEVSQHSFKDIESPVEFDRQKWLERISMFHWKFSELENGTAWRHIRNYCQ